MIKRRLIISSFYIQFQNSTDQIGGMNFSPPDSTREAPSGAKLKKRKRRSPRMDIVEQVVGCLLDTRSRYWQSYRYRLTVNGRTCRVSWHGTVGNSLILAIIAVYGSWIPTAHVTLHILKPLIPEIELFAPTSKSCCPMPVVYISTSELPSCRMHRTATAIYYFSLVSDDLWYSSTTGSVVSNGWHSSFSFFFLFLTQLRTIYK